MRACFLGQNICALGNGIAIAQAKPLPQEPWGTIDDEALDLGNAVRKVNEGFASAPKDTSKKRR